MFCWGRNYHRPTSKPNEPKPPQRHSVRLLQRIRTSTRHADIALRKQPQQETATTTTIPPTMTETTTTTTTTTPKPTPTTTKRNVYCIDIISSPRLYLVSKTKRTTYTARKTTTPTTTHLKEKAHKTFVHLPTHCPINGQWWSNLSTQTPQRVQWIASAGRSI